MSLQECLEKGKFEEAGKLAFEMNFEELESQVLDLAFGGSELLAYAFVSYLLTIKQTSELHGLAATLMQNPLCHHPHAYSIALHHSKMAIALSPTDPSWREMILYLYLTPNDLVSLEEALENAALILKMDPQNEAVKHFCELTRRGRFEN